MRESVKPKLGFGIVNEFEKLKIMNITKDEILDAADKFGFRVPYDGSNKFYNDDSIKGFIAGAEFVMNRLQEETAKDLPKCTCNNLQYGNERLCPVHD